MTLSEKTKNKMINAYRKGNLTQKQQDFIDRAIEQNQITIEELQPTEQVLQKPDRSISERLLNLATLLQTPATAETLRKEMPEVGIKETAKDVLTVAPYGFEAVTSTPATAPLKPLSPVITGLSEAGIALLEDKPFKKAVGRGITATGTEIATGGLLKGLGSILPKLAKTASKANKNIIDKAIKDPELLKTEPKSNLEMTEIIDQRIKDYAEKRSRDYDTEFEKIPTKVLNNPNTDTSKLLNYVNDPKNNINVEEIITLIKREKPMGYAIDLTSIDRLFSGDFITPNEIKDVNSFLGKVLRSSKLEESERYMISGIKEKVFEVLGDASPDIAKINKKYAKQSEKLKLAKKLQNFESGKEEATESSVASMLRQKANELQSKRFTKEKLTKGFDAIDDELNVPKDQRLNTIMNSTIVQEKIEDAASKKISNIELLTRLGMIGTGVGVGGTINPFGYALATLPIAKTAIETEPVAKSLLRLAQEQQRFQKPLETARRITSKGAAQTISRKDDGRIPLQTYDYIKQQRGIRR